MQVMFSSALADGVQFDPAQVLALAIGTVLPLIAGLVTRSNATPGTRAIVLLVLSAITSFLTMWLDAITTGTPMDIGAALLTVLGTFLVGVGTHFGLWNAVGAADAVKRTGGFIGGSSSSRASRDGTV
jgi:hypothetical protein